MIKELKTLIAVAQENGLPQRAAFWEQVMHSANHTMVGGYIPACWAALRRWQEALEAKRSIVTAVEYERVDDALALAERAGPEEREKLWPRLTRECDRPELLDLSAAGRVDGRYLWLPARFPGAALTR